MSWGIASVANRKLEQKPANRMLVMLFRFINKLNSRNNVSSGKQVRYHFAFAVFGHIKRATFDKGVVQGTNPHGVV